MRTGPQGMKRIALALALLVLARASCDRAGVAIEEEGDVAYEVLDERAEPLRGAFEADLGKVRVVMLASPT